MTKQMTTEQIAAEYMARIERAAAKEGKTAGIQRGVSLLCSWALNREFNETNESYLARNPEKKLFEEMFNAWKAR